MLPAQWNTEEIDRHKKKRFWSINQGQEINQTETGRSKVTNIGYPLIVIIFGDDLPPKTVYLYTVNLDF